MTVPVPSNDEDMRHMVTKIDRKDIVRTLIKDIGGCDVIVNATMPKVTYASIEKNRMLCRTNKCGNYNTSWTCPPNCGSAEYCIESIGSCKSADIIMKKYENVDFSDKDGLESIMNGFRDICRKVMVGCRKEGFDVMAFADGPCSYCKECAFIKGKACYHPDMQVPSVSGYGFDMTAYMGENGINFGFSKDSVTLYGVILFKKA